MAAGFIGRVAIVGGGIYLIYKTFVPSTLDMQKHADTTNNGPLTGGKSGSFNRVMELSTKGYSYEAITKIIQSEEKQRYKEIYDREKLERLEAIKQHEEYQNRIFKLDEAIDSAVSIITGNV